MAISDNAISRFPRYRAAIARLKTCAVSKVCSGDIADAPGITAYQVVNTLREYDTLLYPINNAVRKSPGASV
jgi:NADH/NAD ratio-sensing transcriptional regulator Rex